MSKKRGLSLWLENLRNLRVQIGSPRGNDLFYDIAKDLPLYQADVVFDVGANLGQSAECYLVRFPKAHIYSFEPAGSTFQQLQNTFKSRNRVHCFQLALGASSKTAKIVLQKASEQSFILSEAEASQAISLPTESVTVVTLDNFCHEKKIRRINYLKIDTEGCDLEVLKGASAMLREQGIDLVEVEAGMNPGNERHVPFQSLKIFLESYGYFLFGIYEQVNEWPVKAPHLRRTNPVSVSRQTIETNTLPLKNKV